MPVLRPALLGLSVLAVIAGMGFIHNLQANKSIVAVEAPVQSDFVKFSDELLSIRVNDRDFAEELVLNERSTGRCAEIVPVSDDNDEWFWVRSCF